MSHQTRIRSKMYTRDCIELNNQTPDQAAAQCLKAWVVPSEVPPGLLSNTEGWLGGGDDHEDDMYWWCWWMWWTQCAHYHFPWKPFVNLGLHPDTLLYPGMRCRKQRWPTLRCHKHTWPMLLCRKHMWAALVEHPKPWSISCDPQDAEHPNIDMWARAFRNIQWVRHKQTNKKYEHY